MILTNIGTFTPLSSNCCINNNINNKINNKYLCVLTLFLANYVDLQFSTLKVDLTLPSAGIKKN